MEKDSPSEINNKESMKNVYDIRRFLLEKKYFTSDGEVIQNADKLKDFINDSLENIKDVSKLHSQSIPMPK